MQRHAPRFLAHVDGLDHLLLDRVLDRASARVDDHNIVAEPVPDASATAVPAAEPWYTISRGRPDPLWFQCRFSSDLRYRNGHDRPFPYAVFFTLGAAVVHPSRFAHAHMDGALLNGSRRSAKQINRAIEDRQPVLCRSGDRKGRSEIEPASIL